MTGISKRKPEVCDLLIEHAQILKDDPERLSTGFMLSLIKSDSSKDYSQLIIDEKLANLFLLRDKFSRQSRRGTNQRGPNWYHSDSKYYDLFGLIDLETEKALADIARRFKLCDYWLRNREFRVPIVDSRPYARVFTRSEIGRMKVAEYKANREDILKSMALGLILDR